MQRHCRIVDDLDVGDGAQLALAGRTRHGLMAIEAVFHRRRIHRLAVMELDALTQLDGERLVVVRPFVLGRQLRHDLEVGGNVEELVAQPGEDDAPDEGARQRRVENIGILVEPDAQCRLRGDVARPATQDAGGDGAGQ